MANTLDVKSLLKHLVDGDFEEKLCRICLQPLSGLCENIFTKICKENQEYCVADALEELCDFKFAETDNYLVCTECFLNASNAYKFFLNTKRNNEILTFYINEIESNINAIEIPDTVLTDTLCISLPELTPATPNFDYNLDGVLLPCRQEAPKHASIKNENIDDEPTVQIDEEHLVIVKSEDGTQTFYKSLPDGSLMEMVLDKKKKEIQVEKKARKKREPMLYRQCSVCPIKYRFIAKLKEHMRTEHGITLHVCKICQALIEDEEEFRRHLKTHTNIHQCELCDTVFRRRDTMIAHLKWHEDSQNSTGKHVCTTCGEIAKDEDELIDHIDKKHNKNYTCYYCGRMYKGKISFDQHIEKHEKYSKQKEKMELLDKTLKPTGSPLEVPLCPIKKRRLSNIHFFPKPPTATSDSATMEVFTHSVKSIAHSSKNPELQSRIEAASLPIKNVNSTPLSTARKKNPGRQSLKDKTETIHNYGSDLDSEDEKEEIVTVPTGTSRTAYLLMDTPVDLEPPQPLGCQVTDWMLDPIYDFKWQPYPNPPINPEKRRERFRVTRVGPTVPDLTPIELFKLIWDEEFMGMIVAETNKYAQQMAEQMIELDSLRPTSRICDWKPTSIEELYTFFGIILAMGVVIKSQVTEYWSTTDDIFVTPGFKTHMALRRFQSLCSCLHFNDNIQMPENIDEREARLIKINPVIIHLNKKFQSMYNMGQNISLDESLLQWRGWLQINKLTPNKETTVGIKTYEVCESQTGYLWRFIVHSHRQSSPKPQEDPLTAFTPSLVLKILEGLEDKGYTVWMDNFYNSPILARKLKQLGFDCVGTLRTNRQFVPVEITLLQKSHMKPGQITGVTSGDVDLLVWRDQNRVATISTYHGNMVTTDNEGKTKPILIRDYNTMMGGVDKKDQLLSSYPIERKRCRVWYKKLFRRLLNVSVLNAYIIFKHRNRNCDHRDFRKALIKALLKEEPLVDTSPPSCFDLRFHYIKEMPFSRQMRKGRLRRICIVCRGRTTMFCVGCNKSACLNCFRDLHTSMLKPSTSND